MKKDCSFFLVWNVLCLSRLVIGEVTEWSEPVCHHQSAEDTPGECRGPGNKEESTVLLNSSSNNSGDGSIDPLSTSTATMKAACHDENQSSTEATAAIKDEELVLRRQQQPYPCNIYMAPSSIPGAGFGIFTMRDIAKGEKILPYADAPSIPLCDDYANGMEETDWNHVDYLWSGQGLAEYECESVSESVVTFGALCNFHTVSIVPCVVVGQESICMYISFDYFNSTID